MIFGAFEQEKGLHFGEYGGTGLGLAICKKLVDVMDGEISVQSVKGEWTEFSICLNDVKIVEQGSSDYVVPAIRLHASCPVTLD